MDFYHPQKAKTVADQCRRPHSCNATEAETWYGAMPSDFPVPLNTVSDDMLSASAVKAVRQQRYHQALTLLDQLISRHPEEAHYYSNRGLLHLWRKDYDAALNDCNYAIELAPDLDRAYNNRANCYAAIGLSVKALVDYERAVDLNPFNSRARINLGVTLRNLGDFDGALNCFDEALLFYKLLAFIYAERGHTYHRRGDWNCAIADYRRAQETVQQGHPTAQEKQLLGRVKGWMQELIPNFPGA